MDYELNSQDLTDHIKLFLHFQKKKRLNEREKKEKEERNIESKEKAKR